MIELYVWEYPVGDEIQYNFARVDSFDEESDPYNDEEFPDPTRTIWVSESVYQAYRHTAVVLASLQDTLLRQGEQWKGLNKTEDSAAEGETHEREAADNQRII